MKTKIDWPNHLVGFVMIVLSILLAFQLEKCAGDRKEAQLVQSHLKEIVVETEFNRRQLSSVVNKMAVDVEKLDTLLQLINAEEDVPKINSLVFELLDVGPPYIKRNAYTSFTTSGDIRFLTDFEQKSAVVNLYEYHDMAEAFGELLMKNYEDGFWSHIRQNLDLHRAQPQPISAYQGRAFINSLASYRYFLYNCLGVFRQHDTRMEEFIEEFNGIVAK